MGKQKPSFFKQIKADLLLVDDRRARAVAQRQSIPVTGTLGVLELGASLGIIDLKEAIRELRATSFRVSEKLLVEVVQNHYRACQGSGRTTQRATQRCVLRNPLFPTGKGPLPRPVIGIETRQVPRVG